MVPRPWIDDVRCYDVIPVTVHYDIDLDAFFIARADIRSPLHGHGLSLVVSVTIRDLAANRITLEQAILRAEQLLGRLIPAHRSAVDSIDTHRVRVFDFIGDRLR